MEIPPEDDPNVTRLPIKFKNPLPEDRSVIRGMELPYGERSCDHLFTQYIINDGEAEVICGRCKTRLEPMWVLAKLATQDRRYAESQARYQEEQKRLAERKRTKCEHCQKMTRISRR